MEEKVIILNYRPHCTDEYVCEFTDFCNDNLYKPSTGMIENIKRSSFMGTYLVEPDSVITDKYAIRFPGATRGHIQVDENNTIVDIQFYDDSGIYKDKPYNVGCYDESIIEKSKKYIGYRIVKGSDCK